MTALGIHAWLLSSIGIRTAFVHREIMEMLELLHALGNSYRLASLGVGSALVYGRFTLGFCRTVVIGAVCNRASLMVEWSAQRMKLYWLQPNSKTASAVHRLDELSKDSRNGCLMSRAEWLFPACASPSKSTSR